MVRASPIWMGLGSASLRRKGGEVGPVLNAVRLERRQDSAGGGGPHLGVRDLALPVDTSLFKERQTGCSERAAFVAAN